MANIWRSFRSKMILMFGISMLGAGTLTFIVYKLLQLYYHTIDAGHPVAHLRHWMREIGDIRFFMIVFIPLSILLFFLLTERYVQYFHEISKGIHQLAQGDFHSRVIIPSKDEFGNIAADINLARDKLREAMEQGHFAESSKEQLVLNLAHDLRTPLTSVLGYLDYLLQHEELSPDQVKHYTHIAYTKSQRLEKLIDELFEITRMNYGKLRLEIERIDLSELLVQLNEELYPVFEKNHLTTRLQVSPQLCIQGDGELLARVFENLLTNAIRYGADGKYVDIEGFHDEKAGEAVVRIINYGDRIPPAEMPHIFDMFFTGDRARTHREGNTGLGLYIAKNIVEQHTGSITAESSITRTLFEVRLPYDRKESG